MFKIETSARAGWTTWAAFLIRRQEDLDKADPAQVVRNVAAVHAFVICGE
jgi:hypothetical protein